MRLSSLGWYARRLRSMDTPELLWRGGQATVGFLPTGLRYGRSAESLAVSDEPRDWARSLNRFRAATGRPLLLDRLRAAEIAIRTPHHVAELIAAAEAAVAGSFGFLGYPVVELAQPIDWNYDPVAAIRWPDIHSNRIDYRSGSGDPKWIWELQRLQHLPWLAQAWLYTGDDRYSTAAFEHLDSWIIQNPPSRGMAWRVAYECGIRSISVAIALQGLRDAPQLTVERYRGIVKMLAQSASRCWRDRSRYSSANNHLIGEMAGLAVVSMMIPELRQSRKWERRAIRILTREADKQILADGVGAEQSIGYQMQTAELLNLVAALLIQRDGCAPEAITGAVNRSEAYLAATIAAEDPALRYGDDDSGFVLRLGPQPVRTVREHLGIVAGTTGRMCTSANVSPDSLDAQWLSVLALGSSRKPPSGSTDEGGSFLARQGGLVILRSGRRRMTMDVGPLGYLSIAAHGHADALSITLSESGRDLIGDPGTGSYYGHPGWRAAMRGTRAHATVCVDNQDQSIPGGAFLWSSRANARVLGADMTAGVIDAVHDGYNRLPGRVIHRRWLIAPPFADTALVVDLLTGRGTHRIQTNWPLHPSLDIEPVPGGYDIVRGTSAVLRVLHCATVPLTGTEVKGDLQNDLGWWSERLETRVPAWWIGAVCNAELPLVVATLLARPDDADPKDLAVIYRDGDITVTWGERAGVRRTGIRTDMPARVSQR